jgi:hypothetical protein
MVAEARCALAVGNPPSLHHGGHGLLTPQQMKPHAEPPAILLAQLSPTPHGAPEPQRHTFWTHASPRLQHV